MTFVPPRFVTGDATNLQAPGPAVIAHVCNDIGHWGSGFVLAVSRRWPQPERDYRAWYRDRAVNGFGLGAVQLVPVQDGLWVANMVGQHGTLRPASGGRPPVRYRAVRQGLDTLGTVAGPRSGPPCTCPGSAAAWPGAAGTGWSRWSAPPCASAGYR